MKKQEKNKVEKKKITDKKVAEKFVNKKATNKVVKKEEKKSVTKKDTKKVTKKSTEKPVAKKTVKKETSKTNIKKKKTVSKKVVAKNVSEEVTKKPVEKDTEKQVTKSTSKKTTKKPVKKETEKVVKKKVTNKTTDIKRKVKRKTSTKKINDVVEINYEKPDYNVLEETTVNSKSVDKKVNKEPILIGIIIALALLLAFSIFMLFRSKVDLFDFGSNVEDEVIRKLPKEADPIYKETWQEYHNKAFVPDDYVGQIIFESEIINEPVLQGDTNETYVRRNYETYKYEVCGPVFMDYICDVNTDQNLILYGHNRSTPVDPEHVMMFSPLHVLEKEENYDENKLIYMAYEDRLDIYLVASVYRVKVVEKEDGNQYLVKGEPLYYLNNYSPDQFDTYYKTIKQKQMYDTGVELVNTDKLLTLQTCYEDSLDKFIVLAKRIETINYKES